MPATTKKRTNKQLAAAVREAGHAMAAWHLRIMLMPVSIFKNGKGAGRNVWNDALRNVDLEWVRVADSDALVSRLATVLLAGPVAQRRFGDTLPRGESYRRRVTQARALIVAVAADGESAADRLDELTDKLESFFDRAPIRSSFDELRQALVSRGTLDGDQVTRVIESSLRRP